MKRIVVLSALVYIAIAAPTTPDLEEGKSERSFGGSHIGHQQHHLQPIVPPYGHGSYGHGLHGHQGLGLHHGQQALGLHGHHQVGHGGHLYREQDEEEQKRSRDLCAKEVEANCGTRASDVDDASDMDAAAEEQKLLRMIATAAEDLKARINQKSVSAKDTNGIEDEAGFLSFLLKMLGFLAKLATFRSNETGWRHGNSKSHLALHENIEATRRALEDIEAFEKSRNFKNRHHAASDDVKDFEDMPRAELMARLTSVIDKMQKDINADNMKAALQQEDVQKKIETHNEMETSASTSHDVIAKADINSDDKIQDNKFRKEETLAKLDDHDSQKITKSSEFFAAKESDTNMIQGKDAEINMSMKASEHDKDVQHLVDMSHQKKPIENISDAIPKNLQTSGKAVDNTNIEEAQQKKMHHGSIVAESIRAGIHQESAAARQDNELLAKNSEIDIKPAKNMATKNNVRIPDLAKSADAVSQPDFTKTHHINHDAKFKEPETSIHNNVHQQRSQNMEEARDTEFSQTKNSGVFEKHNNPIQKSNLKEEVKSKHTMKSADEVGEAHMHTSMKEALENKRMGKPTHGAERSVHGPSVAVNVAAGYGGGAVGSYGGAASSALNLGGGAGGYGGAASSALNLGGGAGGGAGGYGGAAFSASSYGGAASSALSLGGAGGGGSGAVGVFPGAKVGNCAVPLLLSCSPSVVSGSVAHAPSHGAGYGAPAQGAAPSYGAPAPAYRNHEDFSIHSKREAKKFNARRALPRAPKQKTAILEKVY